MDNKTIFIALFHKNYFHSPVKIIFVKYFVFVNKNQFYLQRAGGPEGPPALCKNCFDKAIKMIL